MHVVKRHMPALLPGVTARIRSGPHLRPAKPAKPDKPEPAPARPMH